MWARSFAHPVAAAFLALAASPAAAQTLVLDAATGPYVEAVVNGVPLRLRVDFDLLPDISLNPEAAARAGLGNGEGRWVQRIGPVRLRGRTMRTDLTLAGVKARTMIRWHARPVPVGADGLVSIHALPFDEVTVERRPAGPGERDIAFETRIDDNHGLFLPVAVGSRRIAARLSFFRPRTTAPAAAAAVIAQRHGGAIDTAPGGAEEVTLGVFRPVYLLELQSPLAVGALSVPRIMVRTADFRGGHRLVRRDGADAGEAIVVTGERRSQESLYRITLGLDVLDRCSAATYRRLARTLVLRCAG
jgi:hypothetical protein